MDGEAAHQGAGKAALRQEGAREIAVISRSGPDNYETLSRHADADLIINTTPVGMYPGNGAAPADLTAFPRCSGVLDVIYNPRRTALLLQAQALGIPCSDGLPMLVAQAVKAEEHFFDRPIPLSEHERILSQLRRETTNLVLIGMPGCGKSTVGVLLAKALQMDFVDTDIVLQQQQGKKLQEIIDQVGNDAFLKMEEDCVRSLECDQTVVATGGSVVYGKEAMRRLHENGLVVYIRLPYEEIERRLSNLATRGVTLKKGQTLRNLYDERIPLYEAEADYIFEPEEGDVQETVLDLAQRLSARMEADNGR